MQLLFSILSSQQVPTQAAAATLTKVDNKQFKHDATRYNAQTHKCHVKFQ